MNRPFPIREIEFWRRQVGLLPVPLFDGDGGRQFVLLNGSKGNFCLELSDDSITRDPRNLAWSSDVGHYVTVTKDFVEVQRWDRLSAVHQKFQLAAVSSEPERFHKFLSEEQPRRELSVITRVMRAFRSLRTALGQAVDGSTSLKALLYLIACATEGVERGSVSAESWRLPTDALSVATAVRDTDWDAIYDEMTNMDPLLGLKPRLDLTLSHAAGQVFQEAHYESIFLSPDQLSLGGFSPRPIKLRPYTEGAGLHFTPPALARTLVEEALSALRSRNGLLPAVLTIFDPACGSGEFLREALRQLRLSDFRGQVHIVGWDISQAACDTARFVLGWEQKGLPAEVSVDVKNVDSLSVENWPTNVDVLLMNPPFQSWQDMSQEQHETVAGVLGDLFHNKPDMSSAFLLKAARSLPAGKILGSIIPASLLDSESARRLREELGSVLKPRLIARLGSQILFANATVDAGVYLGISDLQDLGPTLAFWADHRIESAASGLRALRRIRTSGRPKLETPLDLNGYSLYTNPELGASPDEWTPRPYRSWSLLKQLTHCQKVGDLFSVRQGIRTGANPVFLLPKSDWENLPTRERRYFRPAVVNESIRSGVLSDSAYVFYPYGRYEIDSEAKLKSALEVFYAKILRPAQKRLAARSGIVPTRWWELTRHRDWQIEESPKLLSTYFGDAGSFAVDATGAFVVVQGYAWLPKNTRKSQPGLTLDIRYAYQALLSSSIFSTLLSATSSHVGGGQWNLSKKFVDSIPIPDLMSPEVPPEIVLALVEKGKLISGGGEIDSETNSLVRAAYGVDE